MTQRVKESYERIYIYEEVQQRKQITASWFTLYIKRRPDRQKETKQSDLTLASFSPHKAWPLWPTTNVQTGPWT